MMYKLLQGTKKIYFKRLQILYNEKKYIFLSVCSQCLFIRNYELIAETNLTIQPNTILFIYLLYGERRDVGEFKRPIRP